MVEIKTYKTHLERSIKIKWRAFDTLLITHADKAFYAVVKTHKCRSKFFYNTELTIIKI